jgi:biopolymer transport protein ExbB
MSWAQQDSAMSSFSAERDVVVQRDTARLAELIEDRDALEAALAEARERHAVERERREILDSLQAEQRERLEALAERRGEHNADLDAVGAVVDRYVGDLRDDLSPSWLTLDGATLPARRDAGELVMPAHLESLADSLLSLTLQTGDITRFTAPVAGFDGDVQPREIIRAGDLAAYSNGVFLRRDGADMPPAMVEHTPAQAITALDAFARGESAQLVIDPTDGGVLEALARQPSLVERFHQGGAVGYVVVALGALGLLVALIQYGYLCLVSLRVKRQIKEVNVPRLNNPLGRVLGKFQSLAQGHAPEVLEARLDEALLAELPRLERGQALVKLLAAVAPLLGLLGTVTGMIVTFQAITVYGTGDPQLMAGGISQALVTTVLGLITAVPLLFAHTALVSRSRHLIGLLEGRASATLAEQLECQPSRVSPQGSHHAPAMA